MMKATEIRELSAEELAVKLTDLKKDLFNLRLQHGLQVLMGIDMQGGGATEHAESRNHAYQSEAMVAMKM